MIDQLQELVRRYASNQISYKDFRQSFVPLIAKAKSASARELCVQIEALCAAMERGAIVEAKMKGHLAGLVLPPQFQNDAPDDESVASTRSSAKFELAVA